MLRVKKFEFYFWAENTYVVRDDTDECAIVDPGCEDPEERRSLREFIDSHNLNPKMILLTHAHLDHIYGVREFADRYGIPVYMDAREQSSIDIFNEALATLGMHKPQNFDFIPVTHGDELHFGNSTVRVLSTPGHSRGGVCWWFEKEGILFTGDTLFAGSVGRTDNDCASLDDLLASLRNTLMELDGETEVYPGHGPVTSIGRERTSNPFIYEDF